MTMQHRALFTDLFRIAVDAADPARGIAANLPERPKGRTVVIGAGKASSQMARALERLWPGPLQGVVVTRYGYAVACERIEIIEAAHPVPDEAGLEASRRLMDAVTGLTEDDLVIALISGGGSALLPAPPDGMTLDDEIEISRALLESGAPIGAMNCVRKHLSRIKGGRLAAAARPARVVSLVVSDVPGDDPALVASGPTIPDATSRAEALALVEAWRIELPDAAMRHLRSEKAAAPKPQDPVFSRNAVCTIASAGLSLEAAEREARRRGITTHILSDAIEGESREVARVMGAMAREIALRDRPFPKPVLLLSGGETSVTIRNRDGKGGSNSEFMLALARVIDGSQGISAFAADTDGIDGSGTHAGAFADGTSCARMRAAGLDPAKMLAQNLSAPAFETIGDLFSPGPTGTNVNDFRAILVE